jgi:hypothetical protein
LRKLIFIVLAFLAAQPIAAADGGIRVISWPTPPVSATSAAVKAVSVSSATVTLLSDRTARLKVTLFNEKETLYIKAGLGASITDYTWRMAAATSLDITTYTGPLTAVLGVVGPTTVHVTDF